MAKEKEQGFEQMKLEFNCNEESDFIPLPEDFALKTEEDREEFYRLYNPEDIHDRIDDCLVKMRNNYLNGIYYLSHATSIDEVRRIDADTRRGMERESDKLGGLIDAYFLAIQNEYRMELDPTLKIFDKDNMS